MGTFASDEFMRCNPSCWTRYHDRTRAVTEAEVQGVPRTDLPPERMRVVVVGESRYDIKLVDLAPQRKVTGLPLRETVIMKRPQKGPLGGGPDECGWRGHRRSG